MASAFKRVTVIGIIAFIFQFCEYFIYWARTGEVERDFGHTSVFCSAQHPPHSEKWKENVNKH